MKNLGIIAVLVMGVSFSSFAQSDGEDMEQSCYQTWTSFFEKRGAYDVEDGMHEKVIVTIRKGKYSDCYYGKAMVKNSQITKIYRTFEDDTYEEMVKHYKHKVAVTIQNGMSRTHATVDDELINVLFIDKLMPKKKEFKRAVMPDDI